MPSMSASFSSSDHPRGVLGKNHQYCRRRPRSERNEPISSGNGPPRWVLDEVLILLESHTDTIITERKIGDRSDNKKSCINSGRVNNMDDNYKFRWKLSGISEAKSAQQRVFILKFEDNRTNSSGGVLRKSLPDRHRHNTIDTNWSNAMKTGKNRLVLRIWKGGSRWWNLNRNVNHVELATSEIMGYRIAREAFEVHYQSEHQKPCNNKANTRACNSMDTTNIMRRGTVAGERAAPWMVPKIPRVLHFHTPQIQHYNSEEQPKLTTSSTEKDKKAIHECEPSSPESEHLCWAVLEYVGADENNMLSTSDSCCDNGGEDVVKENHISAKIDRSYLEGMIKTRMEFGFEEPHPRWGRVPVDRALQYARKILHEVLLPLHRCSSRLYDHERDEYRRKPKANMVESIASSDETKDIGAKTYSGMVELYRRALKDMVPADPRQKSNIDRGSGSGSRTEGWDDRIDACLKRLDEEIYVLDAVTTSQPAIIPPLNPVLVHLDLQPQNLIFFQKLMSVPMDRPPKNEAWIVRTDDSADIQEREEINPPVDEGESSVFSVLDWEDAAWADPRFDLVLLCRKVCANQHQADAIWSEYGVFFAADNGSQEQELGPIEPWLRLETVHSVVLIFLQTVDLVNGGRNPWETKKDLWGKLQREFTRLDLQNQQAVECVQPWKVRTSEARKTIDQMNIPTKGCCE